MGKVFTADEFIKKCKWLANDVPTVYHSGKGWSTRNSEGKWRFDCVISIKSLLWNFAADKSKTMGGTVYKSNGVADFTCNGGVEKYSTNASTNFEHLTAGEYLCMKGTKYNHCGVYLGDGKVFECTTGWGTKRCIISEIDSKGNRYYKGVKNVAKWTWHGKLIYIDYTGQPIPINPITVWQESMNKQWNCGLAVDGHYGPLCREQARKHQLYYGVKAPIMVKWLQTRLKQLGYELAVDGSFGPDCKKKTIQFQKKVGLRPDGIVGEDTVAALIE